MSQISAILLLMLVIVTSSLGFNIGANPAFAQTNASITETTTDEQDEESPRPFVQPAHTTELIFSGSTTTGILFTGIIDAEMEDRGQGTGQVSLLPGASGIVVSGDPTRAEIDVLSDIQVDQSSAGTLTVTAAFIDPAGRTGTYTIGPVFSTTVSIDDTQDTFPKSYITNSGAITVQYTGGNPITGTLNTASLVIR
ncbi:MAG: hypothetical protein AB1351_06960 [Thermoproteota archaeon]